MSEPAAAAGPRPSGTRTAGGGLFRRIFLTFVLTVLVSTIVAASGAYIFASRFNADWVADTTETIAETEDSIAAALHDQPALEAAAGGLATELSAEITIYLRPGGKVYGHGPNRPPHMPPGSRRALRNGHPVMLRERPLAPPGLILMLPGDGHEHRALLVVRPQRQHAWGVPLISLCLLVTVLGTGSWVLARSLATRLSALQTSAGRIAAGELQHRVATTEPKPVDEIDDLALSFNNMAERVEILVTGQKTLLANVSHELRTPIARVKVLLEILADRATALVDGRGDPQDHTARLRRGMAEMVEDVDEIEALIRDLLTSGRLDLQGDGILDRGPVQAAALLGKVARKVGARVDLHGVDTFSLDAMLIERLLSNLLANARRACPEGEIVVSCRRERGAVTLAVEDEGAGVAKPDRSAIFEPFTRLDAARDRDRGGVGLGLYLCRQIAAAHGGTIEVSDRLDGKRGARFAVVLPGA